MSIAALGVLALASSPALAQGYPASPYDGGYQEPRYPQGGYPQYTSAYPDAAYRYQRPSAAAPEPQSEAYQAPDGCCVVPAGTKVAVELLSPVGTHEMKAGDTFPIRLAAPLIVEGQVVAPVGTRGVGQVVQASGPGLGGKGAKLVVSAQYLTVPGGAIALQAMQLSGVGKDQSFAANVASAGGLAFMPLGFLGFAVTGGDIEIPAGTAASAEVAQTLMLQPMAAASRQDYAKVAAVFGQPEVSHGWIDLPPPPPGKSQVVFFRPHTMMGTAQWFKVREDGLELGKLTNGAYFVAVVEPGQHTYTATSEPEATDSLTLRVAPGQTAYVEGMLTKGVIIGLADLTPSDKARFDYLSSELKPSASAQEASTR